MSEPTCPICGESPCQCPEVLIGYINDLNAQNEDLRASLRTLLSLKVAYSCPYCRAEIYRLSVQELVTESNNRACREHDRHCTAMHDALSAELSRAARADVDIEKNPEE